jgi:hypothetical protein
VATEAAEKRTSLRQPGALGVWPVQIGRVEERELPIAEIGAIAGADESDPPRQIGRIEEPLQHQAGLRRDQQRRAGRAPQQFRQGAGMVGFQVIEDDGGDFVVVGDRLQTAKKGLES